MNLLLLGLVVVLYMLVTMLVMSMTEPKHPAEFWLFMIFQLAVIIASLVGIWPLMPWFVILIYTVVMFVLWLMQFISICAYNIIADKVYDCEYYGFIPKDDKEGTVHLGLIKEGPFITGVIIEDYDPNADGDIVKVVFDEKTSKKKGGEIFREYNAETRRYTEKLFTAYVVKAKV